MNAPELADKLDRQAESAVPDAMGFAPRAEEDRVEREAEPSHRHVGLVALVAAILVLALAAILFFGAGPSTSDLQRSPAVDTGFSPELALPQAPGLSSASRAFSPSSALGPRADSAGAAEGPGTSVEPMSEIGPRLAPEWALALAIQANPDMYADTPSGRRERTASRAPASQAEPMSPQADALARVPALPAEAPPPTTDDLANSVARNTELGVVSTEIVHPGITRRTYPSLATILEQKVAECRQKGILAAESCRRQVCSNHWGRVPACPRAPADETLILP